MVLIELSGKTKELRYDFNSVCAIEEIADKSIIELMGNARSFNTIRLFIWGGLTHAEPNLTLNDAGNFIQEYLKCGNTLQPLMEKAMDALRDSGIMPGIGEKEKEESASDLGEQ